MLSDSMRVFITVAEKKNFSKAAKALSLTQPAVSFQIQTLEQYYQTMLFDSKSSYKINLSRRIVIGICNPYEQFAG